MGKILSTPPAPPPEAHIDIALQTSGTGRMSRALYSDLNRGRYIEVQQVLKMTLENPIHSLFRREAFLDLSNAEYDAIRPAVTLASRYISEDAMMGFWTRMQYRDLVLRLSA